MGRKAIDMEQPGTQGLLTKGAVGAIKGIGTFVFPMGMVGFMLVSGALSLICALSLLYIMITSYQTVPAARFNELHTLWLADFLGLNSRHDRALLEAAVITVLGSLCSVSFQNVFTAYRDYTSRSLPPGMALFILSIWRAFVAVVVAVIAYVLVLSGMALAGQGQWEIETLQNAQGNDGAPFATKASYALLGLVAGMNPGAILAKVVEITSVLYAADKPQQETSKQ
jgi:hypothetical protein